MTAIGGLFAPWKNKNNNKVREMNSGQIKKKNYYLILTFVFGTIASIAFSVNTFSGYGDRVKEVASQNSKLQKGLASECIATFEELDPFFKATEVAGRIVVTRDMAIKDPDQELALASIGISSCTGYQLKDFCMGDDCKKTMQMTLEGRVDE